MAYKIGHDKKKHFIVGIPLGLLLQFLASFFSPLQPVWATILSFVILSFICFAFEWFSLFTGKGHHDNLDAIAGILGGMIGAAIFWSAQYFI